MSKSSYRTDELEAYQLDKAHAIPEEMLESLIERLHSPP